MLYATISNYINTQKLGGLAATGTTVKVTDPNGNLVGTSNVVGSDGSWSVALDDAHLFTASGQTQIFSATDVSPSGQLDTSMFNRPVTVTYTTINPIIKIKSIDTISVSDSTSTSPASGKINLTGTIDDSNGTAPVSDAGAPIQLYFQGHIIDLIGVNYDNSWSTVLSLTGSGTFNFDLKLIDEAGNVGTTTASYTLTTTQSFGFKLNDATLSANAKGITISGPDGSHPVIPGMTHYQFTDGTVNVTSSSPLIDSFFYDHNNADVWKAQLDPSQHYNQYGWHENRDPNANFSTSGYLAANSDVARNGLNPLTHFDQYGWKEGRDPSANFDTALYLLHNPDVKASGVDPLTHYMQYGHAEGRQTYAAIGKPSDFTHGSFDPEYYLLANPDVAKAALATGGDTFAFAYRHYSTYGWQEARKGNAIFDSAYYLAHNHDVAAAHVDPLAHYDQFGWKEGRNASALFDTKAYLASNTDVAAAHIDPLLHYLQFGALEGRLLA